MDLTSCPGFFHSWTRGSILLGFELFLGLRERFGSGHEGAFHGFVQGYKSIISVKAFVCVIRLNQKGIGRFSSFCLLQANKMRKAIVNRYIL